MGITLKWWSLSSFYVWLAFKKENYHCDVHEEYKQVDEIANVKSRNTLWFI